MRVTMLSDYPLPDEEFGLRPQPTPVQALCEGLGSLADVDLTVITMSTAVDRRTSWRLPHYQLIALPRRRLTGAPLLNLPRVVQLAQEVRSVRPDLVHAQGLESVYAQAAVSLSTPHLVTVHGIMKDVIPVTSPSRFSPARLPGTIESWVLSRMRNAVAISPYAVERLGPLSRARWFDIPNAIADEFYIRGDVEGRRRDFVMAGTLYPLKGMHTAAVASRRLDDDGVHGRLVIYGGAFSSAGRAYRDQLLAEAGMGSRFTLEIRDWAQPHHLAETMRHATATIVGSATENMSMVLAESMATGTPVIASRRGGSPHFVRSGAGLTFDFEDVEGLARGMRQLLDDRELWRGCSDEAWRVAQEFRVPRIARKTFEAYQSILDQE